MSDQELILAPYAEQLKTELERLKALAGKDKECPHLDIEINLFSDAIVGTKAHPSLEDHLRLLKEKHHKGHVAKNSPLSRSFQEMYCFTDTALDVNGFCYAGLYYIELHHGQELLYLKARSWSVNGFVRQIFYQVQEKMEMVYDYPLNKELDDLEFLSPSSFFEETKFDVESKEHQNFLKRINWWRDDDEGGSQHTAV